MSIKKGFHNFLFLLAMVLTFLCLPTCIQAKSSLQVKYSASQKGYFLYTSSNKAAIRPGLYRIEKKKANSHTFDGVYYVSAEGKIGTAAAIHYVPESKTINGKNTIKDIIISTKAENFHQKKESSIIKIHGFTNRYSTATIGFLEQNQQCRHDPQHHAQKRLRQKVSRLLLFWQKRPPGH